jgi:hypothetical protein
MSTNSVLEKTWMVQDANDAYSPPTSVVCEVSGPTIHQISESLGLTFVETVRKLTQDKIRFWKVVSYSPNLDIRNPDFLPATGK